MEPLSVLPDIFLERLKSILPPFCLEGGFKSLQCDKLVTLRVNPLKADPAGIFEKLNRHHGRLASVPWFEHAVALQPFDDRAAWFEALIESGEVYRQGISSMLVPVVLDPQSGERILEMCAAPGSKASQIAAMLDNQGTLICLEKAKGRYYKLKAVLERLGVSCAAIKLVDGRRFRAGPQETFDRILVDAPCSSEGRFHVSARETFRYWSPRKIREMVFMQKGLLLAAARLLRPGGTLVYSTCTFAPEENEGVVDWLLRKTDGSMSIENTAADPWRADIKTYPALAGWDGRDYRHDLSGCIRVAPDDLMSGFFICRLHKNEE